MGKRQRYRLEYCSGREKSLRMSYFAIVGERGDGHCSEVKAI